MKTGYASVSVYNFDFDVEYEYSEYIPEVRTLSNGDLGYPAEGGELYITEVKLNGVDIYDLLADHVVNNIIEKITNN